MSQSSPFANALAKHARAPEPKTRAKIAVTKIEQIEVKPRYASANLIIKDDEVFVPSNGKSETGLTLTVDPIYKSPVVFEPVLENVKKVINSEYITVSNEEVDKLLNQKKPKDSPTLRATHSSSWRNLYKTAAFYSIQTIENETKWILFLNNPNPKPQYLTLEFPISTPLEKLVKIILEDVKKYRHVLGKGVSATEQ